MSSIPPVTIADEGVRLRRVTRLQFAVVWVIPAVLAALQIVLIGDASGAHYSLETALYWQGASWMMWGLWSQVVLTLVDRLKLDSARLLPWIAIHVAVSAVICAVNVFAIAWLDHIFGSIGQVTSYALAVRVVLVNHLDFQVVLYWAVVGAAYMVEFVRRYRERDRAAAALEQKLAMTQLEALRMQLNPHFLFNALNGVSALMYRDIDAADTMLMRLSELLREALQRTKQPWVSLRDDLAFLDRYLGIELIRFAGRLTVRHEIQPETLELQVPNLILQPLVENAIKHGIEPKAQASIITLRAVRTPAGTLRLEVEDNGRGYDPRKPVLSGIGLTNIRARLEHLFGSRGSLRLDPGSSGGVRAVVEFPVTERS